jgi:hypothetical protein
LSMGQAQTFLIIAGLACCVAMSMPQVHIVAYCVDLGYGAARGAEMLSLMLACGVVSIFQQRKQVGVSGQSSWPRCLAWPWVAGCPAIYLT